MLRSRSALVGGKWIYSRVVWWFCQWWMHQHRMPLIRDWDWVYPGRVASSSSFDWISQVNISTDAACRWKGQLYSVKSRLLDQFLLQWEAHFLGKKVVDSILWMFATCREGSHQLITGIPRSNFSGRIQPAGGVMCHLNSGRPLQSNPFEKFYSSLGESTTRTDGKLEWEIRADREPLSYLKNNASWTTILSVRSSMYLE